MTESAHHLVDAGFAALQKSDWALARRHPPDVEQIVASLKAYGTDTLGPPPAMIEG